MVWVEAQYLPTDVTQLELGVSRKVTNSQYSHLKRTFKFSLTLQPKLLLALNRDFCLGVVASLYSAHFLEGAAFKASQGLRPAYTTSTFSEVDVQRWPRSPVVGGSIFCGGDKVIPGPWSDCAVLTLLEV